MSLLSTVKYRIRQVTGKLPEEAGEKDAAWYDKAFEEGTGYHVHYTESAHYPIWTVLIDRIRTAPSRSILEIACGPGQLARALRDRGLIDSYCGFDFSPKRIEQARDTNPDLDFRVEDAFKTTVFDDVAYDIVISTEFLEHIHEDIAVLQRIRRGSRFLGTVPNYPWTSHVRFFNSVTDVEQRYAPYFDDFSVSPILRRETGQTIFVMDGIKN